MRMRNILFLVVLLLANTPLSARGEEPTEAPGIRDVLAQTTRSLGWSPEIMVSAEADGSTSYLIMGESGMVAVYAYANESATGQASHELSKNSTGRKSVFHGYPSSVGDEGGMSFMI